MQEEKSLTCMPRSRRGVPKSRPDGWHSTCLGILGIKPQEIGADVIVAKIQNNMFL